MMCTWYISVLAIFIAVYLDHQAREISFYIMPQSPSAAAVGAQCAGPKTTPGVWYHTSTNQVQSTAAVEVVVVVVVVVFLTRIPSITLTHALGDWKRNVAKTCQGKTNVESFGNMFVVIVAFACPFACFCLPVLCLCLCLLVFAWFCLLASVRLKLLAPVGPRCGIFLWILVLISVVF